MAHIRKKLSKTQSSVAPAAAAPTVNGSELVPVPRPGGLMRVEEARQMLAEVTRVDVAKEIHDKAAAIKAYLRQQGAALEVQNHAAEINLRAERRLGELLIEQKVTGQRHSGRAHAKKVGLQPATPPPTLADLGIEKTQASRWQAVARVPAEKFEEYIKETRAKGGEVTTSGLRAKAATRAEKPGDDKLDLPPGIEVVNSKTPSTTDEVVYGLDVLASELDRRFSSEPPSTTDDLEGWELALANAEKQIGKCRRRMAEAVEAFKAAVKAHKDARSSNDAGAMNGATGSATDAPPEQPAPNPPDAPSAA